MTLRKNFLYLLILLLTPGALASTYYVDCSATTNGSGKQAAQPWNRLTAVNQTTFAPGDLVLFKRDSTCIGTLWPKGSGRAGQPVVIGSYGTGPLPVIVGTGNEAALQLHNQPYWEIRNIETVGGSPYGIHISGNVGELHHFRLTDIVVHDVSGEPKIKDSGLIVIAPDLNTPATFHDVMVDGATVYNTSEWAGIIINGSSFNAASPPLHGSGVVVRNCLVHDVAGDAILVTLFRNALIERNVAWNVGMQPTQTIGTPDGIWDWMCERCVVQYNEGFLTDSPGVDGGVFDIDYGNHDNIVQYNYGHDSQGYCVSVFGAGGPLGNSINSVVRYNVCVNNARSPRLAKLQGAIFVHTWNNGYLDGTKIYNNTIYWSPPTDAPALVNDAEFTGSGVNLFANNLVWSTTPQFIRSSSGLKLEGNLYWYAGAASPEWSYRQGVFHTWDDYRRGSGQDTHGIFADPKLSAELAPEPGSPAISAAVESADFCLRDIFGVEPDGTRCDIGAIAHHRSHDGATTAPGFELPAAQGGTYGLKELHGHWALIAFLPEDGVAFSADARSQVVVLLSMLLQYQTSGVRVLAVAGGSAGQAGNGMLLNRAYDWHLGQLPLLADANSATARAYGTAGHLSTFLLSPQGQIVHRWSGFASSVDLGLALRRVLGPPAGLADMVVGKPASSR